MFVLARSDRRLSRFERLMMDHPSVAEHQELRQQVMALIEQHRKIAALKVVCQQLGCTLAEAKNTVDEWAK